MINNVTHELDNEELGKITRAIIKASVLILEFGAESRLVELTAQRLGKALNVDSVEISLIPSAIVLTVLYKNQSFTTTRRVHHKPINMSIVCDVQDMLFEVEKNSYDADYMIQIMKDIKPKYYNKNLLVFMVGLSCASFSYLYGADWQAFVITFFASSTAMYVRQELARKKFVLFIAFAITAFVATAISSLAYTLNLSQTPNIALTSSVILLAPGFPFINSVLDALKGYLSMGWGRWMQATLLTVATSIGIILAFSLLNVKGW